MERSILQRDGFIDFFCFPSVAMNQNIETKNAERIIQSRLIPSLPLFVSPRLIRYVDICDPLSEASVASLPSAA
jgi:hypothetical protein